MEGIETESLATTICDVLVSAALSAALLPSKEAPGIVPNGSEKVVTTTHV